MQSLILKFILNILQLNCDNPWKIFWYITLCWKVLVFTFFAKLFFLLLKNSCSPELVFSKSCCIIHLKQVLSVYQESITILTPTVDVVPSNGFVYSENRRTRNPNVAVFENKSKKNKTFQAWLKKCLICKRKLTGYIQGPNLAQFMMFNICSSSGIGAVGYLQIYEKRPGIHYLNLCRTRWIILWRKQFKCKEFDLSTASEISFEGNVGEPTHKRKEAKKN